MRIVLMGTGGFAVPAFRSLLKSSYEISTLVTRPIHVTRPGHGRAIPVHPARELAAEYGLSIFEPECINSPDAIAHLRRLAADLHVVCDYGQILSAEALRTARLGGINLHGSLLPRFRGAAPVNWALLAGEKQTGVSVIHMTARLDAGPCLVRKATPIGPDEDAVALEARLAEMGVEAVQEAIDMLQAWDERQPLGIPQDAAQASRAPRLRKSDGEANWSLSAQQIFDQVRALKPWPGVFTVWQRGRKPCRLLLEKVAVVDPASDTAQTADSSSNGQLPPGTVTFVDKTTLRVACGQGQLSLLEIQPAGKKRMTIAEFLRGYPLKVGDRLGAGN